MRSNEGEAEMVIFGRGGRRPVWGRRVASTTLETGHFRCPSEQGIQTYRLVEARQMGTVFSVPVRDLGVLSVYLQCDSCNATYPLGPGSRHDRSQIPGEELIRVTDRGGVP